MHRRTVLLALALLLAAGCGDDKKKKSKEDVFAEVRGDDALVADLVGPEDVPVPEDLPSVEDLPGQPDLGPEEIEEPPLESCNFGYDFAPWTPPPAMAPPPPPPDEGWNPHGHIAHAEPEPPYTWTLPVPGARNDLVMPGYTDNMPLFERGMDWNGAKRCFELPDGAVLLREEEAWELYRAIAEETVGLPLNTAPGVRTVVGLRGTYPGTFAWNGNTPNRFNDTLVLLWKEADGTRRVKEFAAHTDTGPVDFGWHASSSLRPNRRYHYINGWHKDYNALRIDEWEYMVRDDTNKNGHWDSDRNGWLPPLGADDHDRTGSAHNIHMASVSAPLFDAAVNNWSAGCQVIPGIASWTEFITTAWTDSGDPVDYFLIDVRDIDPRAWGPCQPDGTRECPYRIESFPFKTSGNTAIATSSVFDSYNCSGANESGPELFYVFNLDSWATVHVQVDDLAPGPPDIDIHLLDGDSPEACLIRDDVAFSIELPPGRYYIVADTYVEQGNPLVGPFVLDVSLEP